MLKRNIRMNLVATAAALTTAASLVPSLAQANAIRPGLGVKSARPVTNTSTNVALEGHSTGDPGSASEKDCQSIGEAVDQANRYADAYGYDPKEAAYWR